MVDYKSAAQIEYADVAQLAEQLICNQQVTGSSPVVGFMGGFPSGQRGQTVNLLATLSKVRILLRPFLKRNSLGDNYYCRVSDLI